MTSAASDTQDTERLHPGSRLGKYQILSRLALGGMAELYLARYVGTTGFEKVVAIKRVHAHMAQDEDFVRMFLNEARLAAGLDHQNIVHVIDFGTVGRDHFMAMEYVHGRGVHEILRSAKGSIPIECALAIVQGVAAALHYAHERAGNDGRPLGLVHRDVSPSNILVSHEGEVKLVDFGIAKATALTRATRTGTIKGKLAYMAPEQVRGEDIDRRADVFSLGTVLYELTTGQRCFYAPGEFALINRVAEGRFRKPSSVVPDFPIALEEIVLRALQVNRELRYPTARAMQQAIEAYAMAERIQLSPIRLSEFMHGLFGDSAYPQTDVLPLPAVGTRAVSAVSLMTPLSRTLVARARQPVTWIVLAGAVGLAIGLGTRSFVGAPVDSRTAHDAAPSDQVPQREEGPPPARREDRVASDASVDAASEATREDAPPLDAAAAEGSGTSEHEPVRTRRKKPRTSRRARRSRDSKAEAQPTVQEYLPPSRRR